MTDDKTPADPTQDATFLGDVKAHALVEIHGAGKIIWPDGSEVSAEQFQDSVTAAVTGFEKGQAAGLERAEKAEAKATDYEERYEIAHANFMASQREVDRQRAKVARVEALAEQYARGRGGITAKRIRAALAEPEAGE